MKTSSRAQLAAVLAAGVLSPACDEVAPLAREEPAGWKDELALRTVKDENPDPHVLEVHLVAEEADLEIRKGTLTHVYTFGGAIPGPLLELTAGDRLIVHFENHLPEDTTIHWHGVRLPNDMDGVPEHSQAPVPPGGTFDYDFVVPDAGMFWYHPHVASSKQVGFGLYGPIIVRPADHSEDALPKDELVLVLSDIGVQDDGTIVPPDSGGDIGSLLGREGNYILANGRRIPRLVVRSGVTQRWRIVNAARSRYFQLALDGSKFYRIGGDGGLLAHPIETERLLLTPGQRADVLVTPVDDGRGLEFVRWIPFDRGFGSTELRPVDEVFSVDFAEEEGEKLARLPFPEVQRDIAALDTSSATTVHMELTEKQDDNGHIELGINGKPFADSTPVPAKVGETQIWEIKNTIEFSHPFHLHGFFFQAIGDDGAVDPSEWHDTIDVPKFGSTRIAVKFDGRPGHWMFHCHILDHADAGMMGMVDLMP